MRQVNLVPSENIPRIYDKHMNIVQMPSIPGTSPFRSKNSVSTVSEEDQQTRREILEKLMKKEQEMQKRE